MLLIREIMYCKPGKVKPLVQKFIKMNDLMAKGGWARSRIMTDFAGERYWTIVSEFEVKSVAEFESMMQGEGMSEELGKEFEKIMEGYHDLVEYGRREIFKIEA